MGPPGGGGTAEDVFAVLVMTVVVLTGAAAEAVAAGNEMVVAAPATGFADALDGATVGPATPKREAVVATVRSCAAPGCGAS